MKTAIAMIVAASFAATAVQAEEAKPATGTTVAVAQQNNLPAGGLNPGIPFAVIGLGALVAVGVAVAIGEDDDNNSTSDSQQDD